MQQILNFVLKNKTFLLFLLLLSISLALTIQSHSYHRSKFVNSANNITGGIYGAFHSISQYFDLKQENEKLANENKRLRASLFNMRQNASNSKIDTIQRFNVYKAHVYKNSYTLSNNVLTLNKGKTDSIDEDFGVITTSGIVGIIDNVSNNYSTAISILSKKTRINAKLKKSNHIGSLVWDGKSPNYTLLKDVSKFANVAIGDTIVTGGQSSIFPKDIGIGTVAQLETDPGGDTYTINVKLFNDMTNLGTVYIVENLDRTEIFNLQKQSNE